MDGAVAWNGFQFCAHVASDKGQALRHIAMNPPPTIAEPSSPTELPPVGDLFVEITAGLADGDDLEAQLERFLMPVVRLAGAQAGAVRALSSDGTRMRLVGSVGLPQEVTQAERSVERQCGACGQAAEHGSLVWATDLEPCTRRSHGEDYFGRRCRRVLAVPLRHRDRVLGVYNLFFDTEAEPGPDITAVLRSVGELLGLALHNARLEREHLRAIVLHERQMLANEVHDAVAQTLSFMKMRLPLLHDAMLQHDDASSLKYHADLCAAVSDAHASLREILTHFRTRMDPKGLLHALQAIQVGYAGRTGISLMLDNRAAELELTVEQEVQVFHIVQEALANVAKHSHAKRASVLIEQGSHQLDITVEDDGAGLPSNPATADRATAGERHFGLEIMQERAQRIGGTVSFQARAGGGTRVRLCIPMVAAGAKGRS
jgi:two-component system nitrate/nitrite sensor histidine kinase NarX